MFYKHQLTGEIYCMHYIANHVDTGSRFAVYSITTDKTNQCWTCPIELFFSQIEVDGELVDRFIEVNAETD